MITENHGADCWNKIFEASGVSVDSFVSMQQYDDQVTLGDSRCTRVIWTIT